MTDFHTRVQTLFKSRLLHVLDYHCAGHGDAQEEIPQGFEIVLPRAGAYQRSDAHGTFLADPNHILFYNWGEPYDISHLIQGGDSSTVFLFTPSLLIEIIRTYNPDIENNPRKIFQRSHIILRAHPPKQIDSTKFDYPAEDSALERLSKVSVIKHAVVEK